MSQAAEPAKPDFSSAATTLRETVKWLAAAFAATAALVIGSSPLSGLGKIAPFSDRWWLSIALLVFGFLLICGALWRALRILKPDAMYRSGLLGTHDDLLSQAERDELQAVRKHIDAHGADLLPPNYPTLGKLASNLAEIETQLNKLQGKSPPIADPVLRAQEILKGKSARAKNWAAVAKVLPLAQYLRVQHRFEKEQLWMAGLSGLALLMLLGFAIASTAPDKKDDPVDHVIHIQNHCGSACDGKPPAPELPRLPAVLFETNRAIVSQEGLASIQLARDALKDNPRTLLLLQAHTDTMASPRHNQDLAHQRALAVLGLLTSQGGIAPERLMVSYLPETALPRVTPDQKPEQANRSVRLVWLEDTRR